MTRRTARPGVALVVAIMAIVVLAAIPVGLFGLVYFEGRSRANEVSQIRAQELAEAGLAHALGLIDGPLKALGTTDLLVGPNALWNNSPTADDGILDGWTQLGATFPGIPLAGSTRLSGGKYYVRVVEDPVDDPNAQNSNIGGTIWGGAQTPASPANPNGIVLLQCLGVTHDGARAIVGTLLERPSYGILVGGDLSISAAVNVTGPCGNVHANGNMVSSSSSTSYAKKWTSGLSFTGDVTKLTGGFPQKTALVPIPSLNPLTTCASATPATGVTKTNISSASPGAGTYLTAGTWTIEAAKLSSGTLYCVEGNVIIPKGGSAGTDKKPFQVTIMASGSISVREGVYFSPATAQGYVYVSGGDLQFTSFTNVGGFYGTAYCRGQLEINADLSLGTTNGQSGQFVCLSEQITGQTIPSDLVTGNASLLKSKADLFFNCASPLVTKALQKAALPKFQ